MQHICMDVSLITLLFCSSVAEYYCTVLSWCMWLYLTRRHTVTHFHHASLFKHYVTYAASLPSSSIPYCSTHLRHTAATCKWCDAQKHSIKYRMASPQWHHRSHSFMAIIPQTNMFWHDSYQCDNLVQWCLAVGFRSQIQLSKPTIQTLNFILQFWSISLFMQRKRSMWYYVHKWRIASSESRQSQNILWSCAHWPNLLIPACNCTLLITMQLHWLSVPECV